MRRTVPPKIPIMIMDGSIKCSITLCTLRNKGVLRISALFYIRVHSNPRSRPMCTPSPQRKNLSFKRTYVDNFKPILVTCWASFTHTHRIYANFLQATVCICKASIIALPIQCLFTRNIITSHVITIIDSQVVRLSGFCLHIID